MSLPRTYRSKLLAATLLGLALIGPALAQDAPPEDDAGPTASFVFRNVKVEHVLSALSELYGVQFAAGGPVDHSITLISEERIDLDRALTLLDSALAPYGKGVTREGRIVRVAPRGLLTAKVELIRLNKSDPEQVAAIVNQIFETRDLLTLISAENRTLVEQLLPAISDNRGQMLIGQLKVVAIPYPHLKAVVVRAPETVMPIIRNFIETELDQELPKPPKPEPKPQPKPEPKPEPPPEVERSYRLRYISVDDFSREARRLIGLNLTTIPRINMMLFKTRKYEEFDQLEDLIALLDIPETAELEVIYVKLNNKTADEVRRTLEQLYRYTLSKPYQPEAYDRLAAAAAGAAEQVLQENPAPPEVREQFADEAAEEVIRRGLEQQALGEGPLEGFVQRDLGIPIGEVTLVTDTANNALLIRTHPRNVQTILGVIEQIDRPSGQVMINVFIAEVTLDDTLELGVDFIYTGQAGGGNSSFTLQQDFEVADNSFGLSYAFISDNIEAFIRALQTTSRFDLISRPQILPLDNTPALIEFGQRVPLIQTSQINANGAVNQTVRYETVSTRLQVTPQINEAGFVQMKIEQDIDDVSANTFAISENLAPRILITRKARTRVQVRDGQTICLGGFIGDSVDETESKVPLLGDIPLIGNAFKSTKRNRVKSELLIFITPYILRTPDELLAMTNERRMRAIVLSRPGRDLTEMQVQFEPEASPYRRPITRKTYTVVPQEPTPEPTPVPAPVVVPATQPATAPAQTAPAEPAPADEPDEDEPAEEDADEEPNDEEPNDDEADEDDPE